VLCQRVDGFWYDFGGRLNRPGCARSTADPPVYRPAKCNTKHTIAKAAKQLAASSCFIRPRPRPVKGARAGLAQWSWLPLSYKKNALHLIAAYRPPSFHGERSETGGSHNLAVFIYN
jgi:hypothetical protein